jgi:hypothetical protein
MKFNRGQIERAAEILEGAKVMVLNRDFDDFQNAIITALNTFKLVKELAEENESWRKRSVVVLGDGDNFEVTSLAKEILGHPDPVGDPGECGLKHNCAVDTVQKMQERLKKELDKHYSPYFQVLGGELIDRIAKEILEENNG